MGRVFDNAQVVAPGNIHDRLHIAGKAAVMHGHDRLGCFSVFFERVDFRFQRFGVYMEAAGGHVHKYRIGAQVTGNFGGGREGKRRKQYGIAVLYAAGFKGKVQAAGGGVYREAVDLLFLSQRRRGAKA
jgi:hypothetical protein